MGCYAELERAHSAKRKCNPVVWQTEAGDGAERIARVQEAFIRPQGGFSVTPESHSHDRLVLRAANDFG